MRAVDWMGSRCGRTIMGGDGGSAGGYGYECNKVRVGRGFEIRPKRAESAMRMCANANAGRNEERCGAGFPDAGWGFGHRYLGFRFRFRFRFYDFENLVLLLCR